MHVATPLCAFWRVGNAATTAGPAAMFAFWLRGAAPPIATTAAGTASLLAFWAGGGGSLPTGSTSPFAFWLRVSGRKIKPATVVRGAPWQLLLLRPARPSILKTS